VLVNVDDRLVWGIRRLLLGMGCHACGTDETRHQKAPAGNLSLAIHPETLDRFGRSPEERNGKP